MGQVLTTISKADKTNALEATLMKLSLLRVQNQTALGVRELYASPMCGINRIAKGAGGALGSATSSLPTLDPSPRKTLQASIPQCVEKG